MFGVRFKVLGEDKRAVLDKGKKGAYAACFYDYNYKSNFRTTFGKCTIKCFIDKENTRRRYDTDSVEDEKFGLTQEQVEYHLQNLKDVFPTYLTTKKDEYEIELRESEYINHTHIRAALDFIRLMWEDGICETMPVYFQYAEKHELKFSYFITLQAIFVWMRTMGQAKGGHALPCKNYYTGGGGTIATEEEFFEALKTDIPETQNDGSFGLWGWITKQKRCKTPSHETVAKLKKIKLIEDQDSIEQIIESCK